MWPNVPICRLNAAAVSAMKRTIVASSLRGTVTSSRMVVGRRRASAAKALRRAAASCSAFGVVARGAHVAGTVLAGDCLHPRGLVGDGRRMAVGFHQQHRFAVGRQPDVRVVLDAARRHAIEELQRAGDDARRDDGGDGFGGVLDAVVQREHRPPRRRPRHELEQHLGDDAERAFRSDEEILERVTGDVLHARAAEPRDLAVSQDDLQSHDVVARHAVLEPAQSAGVLGDVAADGADALRAGIRRIEQAVPRGRLVDALRDGTPGCARSVRLRGSTSRIASICVRQRTRRSGSARCRRSAPFPSRA